MAMSVSMPECYSPWRRLAVICALAGASSFLQGCGGDSDEQDMGPPPYPPVPENLVCEIGDKVHLLKPGKEKVWYSRKGNKCELEYGEAVGAVDSCGHYGLAAYCHEAVAAAWCCCYNGDVKKTRSWKTAWITKRHSKSVRQDCAPFGIMPTEHDMGEGLSELSASSSSTDAEQVEDGKQTVAVRVSPQLDQQLEHHHDPPASTMQAQASKETAAVQADPQLDHQRQHHDLPASNMQAQMATRPEPCEGGSCNAARKEDEVVAARRRAHDDHAHFAKRHGYVDGRGSLQADQMMASSK
mmetsp:Transcript_33399/g.95856  ORF Transcript_33399/g.95856 Transcript_33399/m.95856 type:complete len:298 (-) Transcript_33399:200-1093(-)